MAKAKAKAGSKVVDEKLEAGAKGPVMPWDRVGGGKRFEGHTFAFTGKFANLRKDDAKLVIAAEGGKVGDKLGKDTTVLVYAAASGGDFAKAEKMKWEGATIALVSEDEFRRRWLLPTTEQALAMLTDGKTGRARLADILELNRPEYMRSPNEFSTVKLDKRSLLKAKLSKVSLCGIHFTDCDLQGADLSDGKWLDKAKKSDFRKATAKSLELVEASDCDFRGANLSKASLTDISNCRFEGANLTGADGHGNLTGSTLDGAKLDGFDAHLMKIKKSSLSKVSLQKGRFKSCAIEDTSFAGADLRGTTFTGDDDDDMVFKNCDLSKADLRGAVLSHVRFDTCNLDGANFEGAKSSEVKLTGGTDASKAKGLGAKEEKKANAKGPAYQALEAAAVTFKNVTIKVFLKIGGKKVECILYQFDHSANTSCRQAWLDGKDVGALTLPDAIATIARQNPKASLVAESLSVKATKGTTAPSMKPKAFEAVVLAAWVEALG